MKKVLLRKLESSASFTNYCRFDIERCFKEKLFAFESNLTLIHWWYFPDDSTSLLNITQPDNNKNRINIANYSFTQNPKMIVSSGLPSMQKASDNKKKIYCRIIKHRWIASLLHAQSRRRFFVRQERLSYSVIYIFRTWQDLLLDLSLSS